MNEIGNGVQVEQRTNVEPIVIGFVGHCCTVKIRSELPSASCTPHRPGLYYLYKRKMKNEYTKCNSAVNSVDTNTS